MYSAPAVLRRSAWEDIVIVDESKCSFLDFLEFIGVALATKVPDQRAVIKIWRNKILKNCYFSLESEKMAEALQD